MYLKTTKLKTFRSFDAGEIEYQKDLTVFVGENNGGKSNAIDAIRLLTAPLGGRREIYCEATDVRFGSSTSQFELEAFFSGLSTGQQGRFISAATDASLQHALFGLRFDAGRTNSKPLFWAGREGNSPEPGCHEMVRHVYLPPLRDAKRGLASGNPTRILALLNHFLEGTTSKALAQDLARTAKHRVLEKVDAAVENSLTALTAGVRRQSATLGFASDEDLIDIARDLRFKMADHGVAPEDLRYSGHGYANLLYMAIIAVELEKIRTSDLTIFLVEEPEAHLHPQLQAAVLSFLQDKAKDSQDKKTAECGPAGELQVVVATHSPNLAAWVSSDRLVVFKTELTQSTMRVEGRAPAKPAAADAEVIEKTAELGNGEGASDALSAVAAAAALRRSTRCIPLALMPLHPMDRRKVDRYLDVTKAALLFGGRILLVEGIAEALLLPVMAKHYTLKNHPDKLRLFRSTVFIPIDGVDFRPYAELLLTAVNGARVAERVVVLTDGDKNLDVKEDDLEGEAIAEAGTAAALEAASVAAAPTEPNSEHKMKIDPLIPGEMRKAELEALAVNLDANSILTVSTSTYSLESELFEAGNEKILKTAYLEMHIKSEKKWEAAASLSGDERAKAIHKLFKTARKGDFAQILAKLIEDETSGFRVPAYIAAAIEAVSA